MTQEKGKIGSASKSGYLYHEPAFEAAGQKVNRSDNRHRLDLLLKYNDWDGVSVIDMGCNVGYFAINLALKGARVTGVELDPEAREFGNNQIEKYRVENCSIVAPDDRMKYLDDRDVCVALSVIPWIYKTEKDPEKVIKKMFEANVAFVEMMYPGDGRAHIPGVTNDTEAIDWLKKYYDTVFKIGSTEDLTDGVHRVRSIFKCVRFNEVIKVITGSQAEVIVSEHTIVKRGRKGKEYDAKREYAALEKILNHNIAPAPISHHSVRSRSADIDDFDELHEARIFGRPVELAPVIERSDEIIDALISSGLRHNDIRPSNMILGNDGKVHLIDFGWATTEKNEHVPEGINPNFKGRSDRESLQKVIETLRLWQK